MPTQASLDRRVKRLHAEEKKLETEYNASSAKLGTFADVLMLGDLTETMTWLKKIAKFNKKYTKAIAEGLITEPAIVSSDPAVPVRSTSAVAAESDIPKFNEKLYARLAEKYQGRTGQLFKFQYENKSKFLRQIIQENQKEIGYVKSVRSTIRKLYDDIDISRIDPKEKEYKAIEEKSSGSCSCMTAQELNHAKREVARLKREIARETNNLEKIHVASINKVVETIDRRKKKTPEEKMANLSELQLTRRIEALTGEIEALEKTRKKLKTDEALITYGANHSILTHKLQKYQTYLKDFGFAEREIQEKASQKELLDDILYGDDCDQFLPDELKEQVELRHLGERNKKAKEASFQPIKEVELTNEQMLDSTIKLKLLGYISQDDDLMDGTKSKGARPKVPAFEDLLTKEAKAEAFNRIIKGLRRSKNPKMEILATYAKESPSFLLKMVKTAYTEWQDRERKA